jgi:hypothetical protein
MMSAHKARIRNYVFTPEEHDILNTIEHHISEERAVHCVDVIIHTFENDGIINGILSTSLGKENSEIKKVIDHKFWNIISYLNMLGYHTGTFLGTQYKQFNVTLRISWGLRQDGLSMNDMGF